MLVLRLVYCMKLNMIFYFRSCRDEISNSESRAKMKDKLREKVGSCMIRIREKSGYASMEYAIRLATPLQFSIDHPVCEKTFMNAWGISGNAMKVYTLY